MTRALDTAIAKVTMLPPDEQDRIAQWLLEELRRATPRFWAAYRELPAEIRSLAQKAYRLFQENPGHPSRDPIYSARVTLGYRAVGLLEDDEVTWFWIGTHPEYDRLLQQM